MSESVFNPEVYGEPVYIDTQFDTEVYGELTDDTGVTITNVFAQAQAQIKQTYFGFAQSQADIKQTYQGYGQCQADIKQIYQAYAQAQACIRGNAFGQAQADIKAVGYGFAQAQADVLTIYQAYAQAQANIGNVGRGFGQCQADIKAIGYGFGQSQADIKQTYNAFAQAQADILTSYYGFGQAQSDIKQTYQGYAQAQADIKAVANSFGQAQGDILATGNGYGQCQAEIKQTYFEFAQAQADIFVIVALNISYAQAQARIKTTYRKFAQATALIDSDIKVQSGNAAAYILKSAGYGQAQALIVRIEAQAQAQAQIKKPRNKQYGQAMALIVYKKGHGQAQARINKTTRAFGQAQSRIIKPQQFGQAQAQVISFRTQAYGQARALINFLAYGQAQATVVKVGNKFGQARARIKLIAQKGHGQAQASITLANRRGLGQANADILSVVSSCGQAMAQIIGNTGYGQAQAYITDGSPIIVDMLADALTFVFNDGYNSTAFVDMTNYTNEPTDADPVYNGVNPADGTWASEYDQDATYIAPNGWFYFTLTSDSFVHFDTEEFGDDHDTILGIYTGTSTPGAWVVVDSDDDSGIGFESSIDNYLLAGTYLFQIGLYGYVMDPFSGYPDAYKTIHLHIAVHGTQGYGQAQATVLQPVPRMSGQAQARIARPIAFGQANAKIKHFGVIKHGLAMARIRLDDSDFINGHVVSNASNDYQDAVMQDGPEAYYTLNELLPSLADPTNMLYKDQVWDNVGLYDLVRPFGRDTFLGYGPYGGDTIGSIPGLNLFVPTNFSAYFSEPTGIPGAVGDRGILSKDENHSGSNYLTRSGLSAPLSGSSNWTVEFWYKPLELPIASDPILLVGNTDFNLAGAISFWYESGDLQVVFALAGNTTVVGPTFSGLAINQWYHVVLRNLSKTNHLYINGLLVDSVFVNTTNIVNSVIVHPNSVSGTVFLLDELAFYDFTITAASIPVHFYAGINFRGGFGQAAAYILNGMGYGQAQATIFNPWGLGQARALIRTTPHRVAQAQGYIFDGNRYGQAQAYITRSKYAIGQAQALIRRAHQGFGQSKAQIINTTPTGMAQAFIVSQRYLVMYNGYQLPGYAQSESFESIANIGNHYAPYQYISFTEYTGLENKNINMRILVWEDNYVACKTQIELAGTMVRSARNRFVPLYIQSHDKHYEAITKSIHTDATFANIKTSEYTVEFEAKPWLINDTVTTYSGTSLIETTDRNLYNGTWSPATLNLSGTNITVSGYTAAGDFTGFISVSGIVNNLIVNTQDYEVTMNGENANALINTDYEIYVGPGVTYFDITGATEAILSYHDRWNL